MEIIKSETKNWPAFHQIWSDSVKATHHFLKPEHFEIISGKLVSEYFPLVELFHVEVDGQIAGFIGIDQNFISMLFVSPLFMNRGIGSRLLEFAIKNKKAYWVDVNEQNEQAIAFYLSKSFDIIGSEEKDGLGWDYPVLHLKLSSKKIMEYEG